MQEWVPEPSPGTEVCGGFDGSTSDDWTGIRLETMDGFNFTPRVGPDRTAAVWDPHKHGGTIPRPEVHAAWAEIAKRFRLKRVYCDPPQWQTEIAEWAGLYGAEVFIDWPTYRIRPMHGALERFATDLATGALTHDGCPHTTQAVMNARKLARTGERYIIGKPSQHQKIDLAMCAVLAHEAAADARSAGWSSEDSRVFCL